MINYVMFETNLWSNPKTRFISMSEDFLENG